jgi:hypothetical protein
LARETSPYLRQHAHNPIDWYPWGPEALERARREQKPIFLSVGYSACHWCHVMEHESFESPEIARLMNEHFINIKVDREERPDLDQIYMAAVQAMTGRGGWPMSVFLTPELEPFYGGTYFPPTDRGGMPGFDRLLQGVADLWRDRRPEAQHSASEIAGLVRRSASGSAAEGGDLTLDVVNAAVRALYRRFDSQYGGFGGAPKFPHPMDLRVCLRHGKRTGSTSAREMVCTTLDHMARGGIYDQLGGGFHRYSTDARWLVPHFEKMLYDNALLAQTYLEAYQAFGEADFARVARETLDYVLREMTAPEGGFYSTQDADSEGHEGKYFVWTLNELRAVLGPAAAEQFAYVYDVTAEGNWEGTNILHRPKTADQCAKLLRVPTDELDRSLGDSRAKLLAARAQRVPPGRDDKVLAAWNGLMIDAMALGYQVLGDARYLDAARRSAAFALGAMAADNGQLRHCYKDGQARFNGFLDDYACLINALVTVYESDFDVQWLRAAVGLAETMLDEFADAASGGFFYTGRSHEELIARMKDGQDSSTPSGNAMATTALARLGLLTGRERFLAEAERTLQAFGRVLLDMPGAAGQMLVALELLRGGPKQIVLAGQTLESLAGILQHVRRSFLPNKVVVARPAADPDEASLALLPLLRDKPPVRGEPTAYVCEQFACQAPAVGETSVQAALGQR